MIKILIVSTIGFNYEGITSVIYNYISNMDRKGLHINFLAFEKMNLDLKKSFEQFGNVFIVPNRKKNIMKYVMSLNTILKDEYNVIHIHGNSGTMAIESVMSTFHRIKNIIVHCHNTTCKYQKVNKVLRPIMKLTADQFLSCSEESGKWLYNKSKFVILNNAINLERFRFKQYLRDEVRDELSISDEFVIGNIGHFDEQKNHTFLIDIFNEFYKINKNSKLLLVGDGSNMQVIKQKAESLGLNNSTIFMGRSPSPERLYQAMDVFLLPSLWEGLPVVMLEAQAAGLPLLVSDCITQEAKCTQNVQYKPLDAGAKKWAEEIRKIMLTNFLRNQSVQETIRKNGFDITKEANKLRKVYESI